MQKKTHKYSPLKVGFIILKKPHPERGFWDAYLIDVAYDWKSIKKWGKKENVVIPPESLYHAINALRRNRLFISEVMKARKTCGLPDEGIKPTKESYTRFTDFQTPQQNQEQKAVLSAEVSRIESKYAFPTYLKKGISDIIKYGAVMPILPQALEPEFDSTSQSVQLTITSPLTKNALIRTIQEQWPQIKAAFNKIPSRSGLDLKISERDFKIVDLRATTDRSFQNIADKISSGTAAYRSANNDSVKIAHQRAMLKINSVFKPK